MNKTVLIVAVGIIVFGGLIGGYFLSQKQNKSSGSIVNDTKPTEKLPSKTLKDYKDESGFTISYPDDLSLEISESTDSSVYSDVSFTSKDLKGSLNIKIADTKVKTLDEYIEEAFDDSAQVKDSSLGALPAREISKKENITLVALDQGVLFSVMTILEDEKQYWTLVHKQIADSFAFEPVSQSTSGSSSQPSAGTPDIIFEGEEVIE